MVPCNIIEKLETMKVAVTWKINYTNYVRRWNTALGDIRIVGSHEV